MGSEQLGIVSKSIFSKLIGLSASRISGLIEDGLPVRKDGRIDRALAERWIADNLDPVRRLAAKGAATKAPIVTMTTAQARTAKLTHEAGLASLKLRQRQGELVDRKAAEAAVFGRARFERDSWIGWTARAAPALAAAAGADPAQIFGALDKSRMPSTWVPHATRLRDGGGANYWPANPTR